MALGILGRHSVIVLALGTFFGLCLKTIFNQWLACSRQTLFSRSGFKTSKNGAATDFISN